MTRTPLPNSFAIRQSGQRGIAMIVALFALLLLSVIGLGMMYSTNMETAINANYHDKQVSLYAAMAGLQQARDRIQPATHHIVAPTGLSAFFASGSTAQVFYIVSDSSVEPWNPSNRYFDTELCQERVFGLSPTTGPCTSAPTAPSGTHWYEIIDNSLSSSAPWNLLSPLDMKWTRIMVKGNNMSPYPVNGSSSVATQTCWDGANQKLLPPGFATTCGPNGGVASISIVNPGSGYNPSATATLSAPPPGGVQATADVVVTETTNGQVVSIDLGNGGSGYTSPPTVVLTPALGDPGSGASATATLSSFGSPVTSLTLDSAGGQCFASTPTVSISGGGGFGATATATLAAMSTCVASLTVSGACDHSLGAGSTVHLGLSGGSGSGFDGTVVVGPNGKTVNPNPYSTVILNPGGSYTGNPTAITGSCAGSHASITITPNLGKLLQSITLTNGGSNYTSVPTVTVGGGIGSSVAAPSITATIGAGATSGSVTGVIVNSGGSGYVTPPSVSFVGGAGSGAAATANLGLQHVITGVTVTNPGSGYLANPTVTINGNGYGSGAQATATLGRGTHYGKVWTLTSLAETRTGARTMAQMEVASPVLGYASGGALTLDGPSPIIAAMPNSTQYWIDGHDQNSCGQTADPPMAAIAGYDDPNADPPTNSVQMIIDSIPTARTGNYIGSGTTPSVVNGYYGLGETMSTPTGLKALIDAIHATPGAHIYGNDPDTNVAHGVFQYGSAAAPAINYINGNLTLSGATDGYGILVVTGTLYMGGDYHWHGPVFVVGDGIAEFNGGGNAEIDGTVIVAKIWDNYTNQNLLSTLGSPSFSWDGGGTNSIKFDHCWADNLMNDILFEPPPTTKPLKVLSFRMLPY
jgi:hypothetical protein